MEVEWLAALNDRRMMTPAVSSEPKTLGEYPNGIDFDTVSQNPARFTHSCRSLQAHKFRIQFFDSLI